MVPAATTGWLAPAAAADRVRLLLAPEAEGCVVAAALAAEEVG